MSGVSEKIKSKIKSKVGDALHLSHHREEEHSAGKHNGKQEHAGLPEFMHKMKRRTKKKISVGGKHQRKAETNGRISNEEGEEEEESHEEEEQEEEDIEAVVEEGVGFFESLSELLSGIEI
ncbi:hypothetical protein F511_14597 [Dorcoceras hygrometricum]|uniref:Uncharacterized protein n=1 Tax=Dorcoceras hygrometricum TaxID=472368 RepID=A0A2Z7CME2_9LAMI|nr:hypothetical protein F511_14597 [Dorcoceras hygrometricum]